MANCGFNRLTERRLCATRKSKATFISDSQFMPSDSAFDLSTIPPQTGRIAIVTGANTGLGYETALGLATTGAKVILACRNRDKAKQAQAQILRQVPNAQLELIPLDLSLLASVREFAQQYRDRHSRLDLLINNAGIMFPPYSVTEDGFESQFAVNYLSHFLLTSLLLDLMPDSPDSRIISLSSNAHKFGNINFNDLQSEQTYSAVSAYGQSKLACLLFANELNRRLHQSDRQIRSLCAHPGVSNTELPRYIPKAIQLLLRLTPLPYMAHSPDKAAQPTLYAALQRDIAGGEYVGPQGVLEMSGPPGKAPQSDTAQDEAIAQRLWQVSERLVGLS